MKTPPFEHEATHLCPAAWLLMPTMCTSASMACSVTSAGVWNSGLMSTSKPRSARPLARTRAPLPVFVKNRSGRAGEVLG